MTEHLVIVREDNTIFDISKISEGEILKALSSAQGLGFTKSFITEDAEGLEIDEVVPEGYVI